MNIDRRLAELGDELVEAINKGEIFSVEHITTEMDYLQNERKDVMEMNPLKASYG
jgi:hypothetical protein